MAGFRLFGVLILLLFLRSPLAMAASDCTEENLSHMQNAHRLHDRKDAAAMASPYLLHMLEQHNFPKDGKEFGSQKAEGERGGNGDDMAAASLIDRSEKIAMYTDGDDLAKEEGQGVAMETTCPASCFMPDPVCGKDGVTYWCGSVDAECSGMEVEHAGYCQIGSHGTGSKAVLAIQSLLLVHMLWLVLAVGLVFVGVI